MVICRLQVAMKTNYTVRDPKGIRTESTVF